MAIRGDEGKRDGAASFGLPLTQVLTWESDKEHHRVYAWSTSLGCASARSLAVELDWSDSIPSHVRSSETLWSIGPEVKRLNTADRDESESEYY